MRQMELKARRRGVLSLVLAMHAVMAVSAAPPSIDYQPQAKTVILYQQAAFAVTVSGTVPLHYQWRKDGVPIAGATNDQLVFAHAQFSDASVYSVVVSNVENSVTSADADLTVNAPKAGDVDFSYAIGSSINGPIFTLVLQSDGKALLGGGFSAIDGVPRNALARLNQDGTLDTHFLNGLSGPNNAINSRAVSSILVQNDGKALIGGTFTTVNGLTHNRIARLDLDGTLDQTFQTGSRDGVSGPFYTRVVGHVAEVGPTVTALGVQGDGKVVLGGAFTIVNSVSRNEIARLNADGSLDEGFNSGSGVSVSYVVYYPDKQVAYYYYYVACLALQPDGKVVIGGTFVSVDGVARRGVARLNADGSLDTTFQNGLSGVDGYVYSMALQTDGKVIVGGAFNTVNGVRRNGIARLNVDGSLDREFQNELSGANGAVYALVIQSDSEVLIGGGFTVVNGVGRNRLARLNPDGTLDTEFQNGLSGPDNNVNSIALRRDGTMLIGGAFTTVNGVVAPYIAQLWGSADVPPHIVSISQSGGDVKMLWDAIPYRSYRVQYKQDLSANIWMDLAGDVPFAGGTATKTDTTLGVSLQRYYRVVLLP